MFVTVVMLVLSRALPGQDWQLIVKFLTSALGNALIILACVGRAPDRLAPARQRDWLGLRSGRPRLRRRRVRC
jgi:hypothetical protein